jgi:hypothetical protein
MKRMNEQQMDHLLSQYVDGSLSEIEIQKVKALLALDILAQQRVRELKQLKDLLTSKQKLAPDIGFWTRFAVALEDQKKDEHNLLPFPFRFVPAISIVSAVVVVVVGTLVIQNRMQFVQYFSKKSQVVREVYEKNVLQGQLLPLFSKVDKDRALQFSLFGTLALDNTSKTELRVDEQSKKGYRIEVGKDSKNKVKPVTFNHFLAEVKPTNEQKHLIDSLLELTGRRIESSVLIGENNVMAIAPDLPNLNKMMVTNIAACLEPNQRVQFERLLEANDAPYTVTAQSVPVRKGDRIFQNIPQSPRDNRFVIITPDTMMYSQLYIDFDSLRRHMEENIVTFELRREAMLKRIIAREFHHAPRNAPWPPPIQSFGNEEFINVEINVPAEEIEQQQMHVIIQPRIRKQTLRTSTPNHSIEVRVWRDTASQGFTR